MTGVVLLVPAFGTVGLSRGLTSQLTKAGRVVIILSVMVRRIGPLILALAMGGGKHPPLNGLRPAPPVFLGYYLRRFA